MRLRNRIGLKFCRRAEPGFCLTLAAFIIIGASMGWMSLDSILHDHRSVLPIAAPVCTFVAFGLLCAELTARSRKLSRLASALRDSEARFRDFALTASDWFWETDQELRFTYTSDSIRVFGQDPDTRIGRTRVELAADAETEPEKWREHLSVLGRRELFRDFVYRRRLGDQPEQILSISGRPVFDAAGRFLGYRGTARDVTEKIGAELRLEAALSAADSASRAKSQFLANMSHELRTPLNAILGFAEMIALGISKQRGGDEREHGELIIKAGRHLLSVIDDVLDLAKIEAGKLELQEEPIDPRELVQNCVELIRETAEARGVDLSTEYERCLPCFSGDPLRLQQALLNLLSNAIKFTEPGGQVSVRTSRGSNGGVMFAVHDTGVGMTAAEIATALERFGQVDGGFDRRHQGTGLGLPLARSFVQLHAGSLDVASVKGQGTTVTITIPASRFFSIGAHNAVAANMRAGAKSPA